MNVGAGKVQWAGVRFYVLYPHDMRMFRQSGLYGFVRRDRDGSRTLLFIDQADHLANAAPAGSPLWNEAAALGMNEVHLWLGAASRIDRLQLKARIVRVVQPGLNRTRPAETAETVVADGRRTIPGVA